MQHENSEQRNPRAMRVDWDAESDNYNSFVMCELEDTAAYLDLVDIEPDDTVLDVCCGPGRITMLAADRAKHVTAIDLFPKMLQRAQENVAARGLGNVTFQRIDWNCVLPGQNVAVHDVVVASRNLAMFDVEKLSALARKKVMLQIFANAPSIPALQGVLFSGCVSSDGKQLPTPGGPGFGRPGGPGSDGPNGHTARRHGAELLCGRETSAYFDLFVKAYNAGFDPNVRIMPERFRKQFSTRQEALEWVCALHPDLSTGNEDRIAANIAPFVTDTSDGVEFCIATMAAIIWWDVRTRC